jgi:hypothetical protein
MIARREAVQLLASASVGAWFAAAQTGFNVSMAVHACAANYDATPPLAPGDGSPVSLSRERIAARRQAGGRRLYTEYPGEGHTVYEWAFTEPALVKWVFSQRRGLAGRVGGD